MVLGFAAVVVLAAAPGFSQAPSQSPFGRAVKQLVEDHAGGPFVADRARVAPGQAELFLTPRRNRPFRVTVVEPGTTCAIPLLEAPIDKRAVPLERVPPLKRTAPMPTMRPRVCPKR